MSHENGYDISGIKAEQFIPLGSMVVIEKLEHHKKESMTKGGIYIPESAAQTEEDMLYAYGIVVSSAVKEIKKGNLIAYSIAHGVSLIFDGEHETKYYMVPFENIYAIINPVVPEGQLQKEK